jgi:hypothetical protein
VVLPFISGAGIKTKLLEAAALADAYCAAYVHRLRFVCIRKGHMGTPTVRRVRQPKARQDAPKRKNYRLQQSKLDAARRVLGTRTETETIERALDLVVFGERLASGTARARGRAWNDVVGEMDRIVPGA